MPGKMCQVAFYFAFMHHYTRWLFFLGGPAVISLLMLFLPVSVGCPKAHRMYERRMSVYSTTQPRPATP